MINVSANTLKVLQLTGADIKAALELCVAVFAVNDCGEIDYELSVDKPIGQRVTKLIFQGQPITDDMTLNVAMNSYRAIGAEFPMFQHKRVVFASEDIIPEIIRKYIKQHSPIRCYKHGHFQVRCTK